MRTKIRILRSSTSLGRYFFRRIRAVFTPDNSSWRLEVLSGVPTAPLDAKKRYSSLGQLFLTLREAVCFPDSFSGS